MSTENGRDAGYDESYAHWKRWAATDFGRCDDDDARVFEAEIAKARKDFPEGTRVLEVGFGNGAFLAFARARGWEVEGVEASAELVARAVAAGYRAHLAADLAGVEANRYDLVAAFDVLEHVPGDAVVGFVDEVKRVLVDGGVFMARVPNGDSPFGLVNQNGDLTHVTAIGSGMVHYLARRAGATLLYVGAQAVAPPRGRRLAVEARVRRLLIRQLDRLLNWI